MAASILTDKTLTLHNIPFLSDVDRMKELLGQHGVSQTGDGRTLELTAKQISTTLAPYEIVSKMRASILVFGPLLARCGEAIVSLPGGCAIGNRPVNIHVDGLRSLGAEINVENGYIHAKALDKRLVGADITLPIVTVTGTENIIMAATLDKGRTTIRYAA
jgi:UDP-N-acetylglucosamine 1-carboxyvinyltransferase